MSFSGWRRAAPTGSRDRRSSSGTRCRRASGAAAGSSSSDFGVLRVGRVLRRPDVVGVQRPVVVVAEQLRAQPGARQRRPDRLDQPRLLVVAQVHARVAARVAVLRLVLERERVDRHARARVVLHEPHEVARVGVVDARVVEEAPADQRVVGLHPRRRAPRRAHDLQVRVVAPAPRAAAAGSALGRGRSRSARMPKSVSPGRRRRRRCSAGRRRSPRRRSAGAGS